MAFLVCAVKADDISLVIFFLPILLVWIQLGHRDVNDWSSREKFFSSENEVVFVTKVSSRLQDPQLWLHSFLLWSLLLLFRFSVEMSPFESKLLSCVSHAKHEASKERILSLHCELFVFLFQGAPCLKAPENSKWARRYGYTRHIRMGSSVEQEEGEHQTTDLTLQLPSLMYVISCACLCALAHTPPLFPGLGLHSQRISAPNSKIRHMTGSKSSQHNCVQCLPRNQMLPHIGIWGLE